MTDLLKEIKNIIRQTNWSQKDIASKSGVPLHFVSDLASGRIEKGNADYKNEETINQHLETLNEFFKPYKQNQEKLSRKAEKAENEKNVILNKSNYKSKSQLEGIEYNAQYNYEIHPVNVLIYDIEVSPAIGAFYGGYNVNPLKIFHEQEMLSFAYKKITIDGNHSLLDGDEDEVKCITLADVNFDHSKLIRKVWEIMKDCEVVCGYNNKRFDDRHCAKYLISEGLTQVDPIYSIDVFKEWKKVGVLTKNGLDYVSKYFNDEGKTEVTHSDLWEACWIDENREAYKMMSKYNKQDVVLTYNMLKKLLPYMTNYPANFSLILNHPFACPKCGALSTYEDAGHYYTKIGRYYKYKCNRCNSYVHGRYQDSTLKVDDQYIDVRPILKG